ncbi:MAG: hypothetical protein AYK18_15095 [Theionarchaea archaeon DG-70]|nr:MAG: hypothetical protein AYK18_15095 [Theionarchaea archaeon DG-70]
MKCYRAPLYIDFDVTLACNMKCRHCNVAAHKPLDDELSLTEIKALIDEMFNIGVYDLSITGGKPLMRKDWKEILLHTHQYSSWRLTLNTNGILWNEADVAFVSENVPHFLIAVSFDGHTPETYGILRRTPAGKPAVKEFEKAIKTLKLLMEYGAQVALNYTITKKNMEYFIDAVRFAHDLGVGMLGIKFFPYGRGQAHVNELELDYGPWADFLKTLTVLKEEDSVFGAVSISTPCPWEMYLPLMKNGYSEEDVAQIWDYESPLMNENYRQLRDLGCNAGITSCAISPDGAVYPCGTVSAKIPAVYCGNIRENGLLHVWETSLFLKKIRELKLSQIEGHCQDCEFKTLCGGGCRARAIVQGGTLTAPDMLCPYNCKEGNQCGYL